MTTLFRTILAVCLSSASDGSPHTTGTTVGIYIYKRYPGADVMLTITSITECVIGLHTVLIVTKINVMFTLWVTRGSPCSRTVECPSVSHLDCSGASPAILHLTGGWWDSYPNILLRRLLRHHVDDEDPLSTCGSYSSTSGSRGAVLSVRDGVIFQLTSTEGRGHCDPTHALSEYEPSCQRPHPSLPRPSAPFRLRRHAAAPCIGHTRKVSAGRAIAARLPARPPCLGARRQRYMTFHQAK